MYGISEINEYIISTNIRYAECVVDLLRLGKRKQIATERLLAIQTDKESVIVPSLNHLKAMNPLNKPQNRNITVYCMSHPI